MPDKFLMEHGKGVTTVLYRRLLMKSRHRDEWKWVDLHGHIEFDEQEGRPVDCFGLPILGKFIDTSIAC
jgi:hypothetical protein